MKHRMIVLMTLMLIGMPGVSLQAIEFKLGKYTLDMHGFLSQGYLKSDQNNFLAKTEDGSFDFREYGLNLSSNLTGQLYVGAQVFGRDLGKYGNNEPVLDWGLVDYHFQDWLGFRAGRMKIMLGLYNETRDIDLVRTGVFLPESFYNEVFRESFTALNGIGLYGALSLKSLGTLSYQAQYGAINIEPDGGLTDFLKKFIPMDIQEVETSPVIILGAEWVPAPPLDSLRLRWTWNLWDTDITATTSSEPFWQLRSVPPGLPLSYHADFNVTSLSIEYRWRDLVLAAETYAPAWYDNELKSPILGMLVNDSPNKVGYYASAAYSFTDWFELGVAYSEYYNNTHDRDGKRDHANLGFPLFDGWQKDTTISTRFDIHEHWVIKLEGHIMNGVNLVLLKENPDGVDQHWFLFAAKVTYSF
jgi:hypothetical protein